MANSKHLFVFLLVTLLSSIHIEARGNQMFNKIPSNTNELEKQIPYNKETNNNPMNNPKEQEISSLPENENNYGLYAHQTVNLPPSSLTQNNNNKNNDDDNNFPNNANYLPKNYNPVAYVTEPEDFNQDSTFSEKAFSNTPINNNYETNGANNYHNAKQHGVKVFDFVDRNEDSTLSNMNYNNYYKGNDGNSNFNNYNNRLMDSSFATNNNNNNNFNRFGGRVNRVQPQGMSDTRFLENGRYYYDINSEKYSVHPNENAMAIRNQYHPRGMFGNHHANSDQYNNFNDAQVQYQDDNNMT
ncbi:hypothetical protein LIER_28349 [Lithospermum erythrorhizon]|uniref:Uncharacterized protein n=1 Tax=Lithospermum erythrorhizon TaxID=34254 RepID=A0AAV3RH13_LITER